MVESIKSECRHQSSVHFARFASCFLFLFSFLHIPWQPDPGVSISKGKVSKHAAPTTSAAFTDLINIEKLVLSRRWWFAGLDTKQNRYTPRNLKTDKVCNRLMTEQSEKW